VQSELQIIEDTKENALSPDDVYTNIEKALALIQDIVTIDNTVLAVEYVGPQAPTQDAADPPLVDNTTVEGMGVPSNSNGIASLGGDNNDPGGKNATLPLSVGFAAAALLSLFVGSKAIRHKHRVRSGDLNIDDNASIHSLEIQSDNYQVNQTPSVSPITGVIFVGGKAIAIGGAIHKRNSSSGDSTQATQVASNLTPRVEVSFADGQQATVSTGGHIDEEDFYELTEF